MSAYPLHDKLKACETEARVAGEFLDWLYEKGYHIARYVRYEGRRDECLEVTFKRPDELIGEFLEISPVELEREKQVMLETIL